MFGLRVLWMQWRSVPRYALARGGSDPRRGRDVASRSIIELISNLGPPVRVVRGNCDDTMELRLIETFTVCGVRIHLEHIPPKWPPERADLLLHGHTHVPRDEITGSVRYLNPGSVGKANKGAPASYAWLHLETRT